MTDIHLPVDYTKLSRSGDDKRAVREAYIAQQDGKCHHCQMPLSGDPSDEVLSKPVNKKLFPAAFFDCPVHLHHDHNTGLTIGVVHGYCNAVLWQYYGE